MKIGISDTFVRMKLAKTKWLRILPLINFVLTYLRIVNEKFIYKYKNKSFVKEMFLVSLLCLHLDSSVQGTISYNLIGHAGINRVSTNSFE